MQKNATKACLDTSALVEVLYATEKGKNILDTTNKIPLTITVLTIHEILTGMKSTEIEKIEDLLNQITVTDFTKECAVHSSVIEKHLRKKGKLVNKMDILIAGTCMHNNLRLVTCDHDFEKIKGIQVTII